MRQVEGALRPADPQTVRQWLTALGVMVAGQMTAADAKAKVGAYVPMLDHPASCFTRETLEEAGRAFKFFPSFSEVAAFLDSKADPLKTLRQRLEAVLRAPVTEIEKPAKRYSELTEAERAEVDAKFARAKAEARSRIVDEPAPTIKPIHIRSPELDAFVAAAKAKEPESV